MFRNAFKTKLLSPNKNFFGIRFFGRIYKVGATETEPRIKCVETSKITFNDSKNFVVTDDFDSIFDSIKNKKLCDQIIFHNRRMTKLFDKQKKPNHQNDKI
jgi:hypothetical protein